MLLSGDIQTAECMQQMPQYNKPSVLSALDELSNRDEQCRLWLSDGISGEVYSFEEVVCTVFDVG